MENHPAYAGYPVPSANLQPGVYHPFIASNLVVRIPSAKNPHLRKTANHREGRKDMRRRYDSGADQRGADIIDLSLDREDPYSIKVSPHFSFSFPLISPVIPLSLSLPQARSHSIYFVYSKCELGSDFR